MPKGLKPPSRKEEAPTSPEKSEGGASSNTLLSKLGASKDGSKAPSTPEKPPEEEIQSIPFEPEMLPHLDMSNEEIGCYISYDNQYFLFSFLTL